MKRKITIFLAALVLLSAAFCTANARGLGQRSYRVSTQGNGEDVVTLMIYLCGSDLESEGAAASIDLEEIALANISENLNIIVETGGASEWAYDHIAPDTNERWKITSGEMEFLEDAGLKNMSEGSTLTDFIEFCAENYPADRYMLVLWDHGGGTVGGYAYDERFGTDMMAISELGQAIEDSGVIFDMIGFDCCLMGTAETAYMVEKYADYMVASQRTEPGDGWHYTPWIDALSENTSLPTDELGRLIVDSFIEESKSGYYGDELTLSVIDLTYIPDLFESMYEFFASAETTLVDDRAFLSASKVLSESRAVVDNEDLVDLVYLLGTMDGAEEVLEKLDQCIAYNGATIDDHNGLCLYFPYTDLSKVSDALTIYDEIGIDESYRGFITTFANLMAGGQIYSGGGTGNPLGGSDFDSDALMANSWIDQALMLSWDSFFEETDCDTSELAIEEKGDEFVLSLPDEEWEMITAVEQRVFLDDGEGYIDLGADSMYEFDEDGDLLISFDNTWVSLDGQLVCFYTKEDYYEDDDSWYSWGTVPIWYEEKDAELIVMWDDANPSGYVVGWRYTGEHGGNSQRGMFDLKDGMTFDFVCEYYTYDEEYEGSYLWGGMTVDGEIEVSYEDVGDADCLVYYELYDLFRNAYWTEAVIYSLDY